ncbi:hypothetical protein [Kribbella sp. NPDC003557]|uniref:hypothetical protein n=1 Tax=Kribbella sp. NPDC003557 TaxID=3154449 RepID=UPI0033AF64A5
MTPYEELPGFEAYVLEESWVLDVTARPTSVVFRMDLVLTPQHPRYLAPEPGNNLSYVDGHLVFDDVTDLEWVAQGAPSATDATGEIDYGHIDTMTWDSGLYELRGDWGEMRVRARTARVVLA